MIMITGCGGMKVGPELYDTHLTKMFACSKDTGYLALLHALHDMKISVKISDQNEGVVITDRSLVHEAVTATGTYTATATKTQYWHKYSFKVTGDDNSCTVRTTKYKVWQDNKELPAINTKYFAHNHWTPLFRTIEDQIEEVRLMQKKSPQRLKEGKTQLRLLAVSI